MKQLLIDFTRNLILLNYPNQKTMETAADLSAGRDAICTLLRVSRNDCECVLIDFERNKAIGLRASAPYEAAYNRLDTCGDLLSDEMMSYGVELAEKTVQYDFEQLEPLIMKAIGYGPMDMSDIFAAATQLINGEISEDEFLKAAEESKQREQER